MGFTNEPMPWSELEARLSGAPHPVVPMVEPTDHRRGTPVVTAPAWSRKRQPYVPPRRHAPHRCRATVPYAELHCHSSYSFLDGVSPPEALAEEAARLGLEALALTDHDGLYGIVRFAEAARVVGLRTVFGAEVTLRERLPERERRRLPNGVADPPVITWCSWPTAPGGTRPWPAP